MRPITLSHEKPITDLKYNVDGDLLFTACKVAPQNSICVWWADSGERIGTYEGHKGAVYSIDVDNTSKYLLSGAADQTIKLWDVESGNELYTWGVSTSIRCVSFAPGLHRFLSVTDAIRGLPQEVSVYKLSDDMRDANVKKPVVQITAPSQQPYKITRAIWGYHSESIVTANSDGFLRIFHAERSKTSENIPVHKGEIRSLQFDKYNSTFLTASKDGFAKLIDTRTFKVVREYDTGRPLNAASMSPLMDHIIVGGGEEAVSVTLTAANSAQFNVRFFHSIFAEELGNVSGHFGPVNVLSFSPDGRSFASGGEDGSVRLHYFNDSYFNRTDEISQY
uniref:Serine-threonine kinase receptor-associated protein n=1 Tax=Arcella intermedia TaxID=1963864 RepID=A0A6B2L9Y8_9EUKA|eukprot:TRINITY_DN1062_c0_g1_i1.p1 TRINITY_DN1062_c0_g1~~TRINITY_DN1062_c0_g1_i1.p1  ORF type:complete len:335 (-),score=59.10 TRINITY_DN1062_c0_g1_i1:82-1086(-)